jgi:nucleoid DNA-binding protein
MNKNSLLNKIIFKVRLNRQVSSKIIDRVFELVKDDVVNGNAVEIENFGKFEKIHKPMMRRVNKKKKTEELLPPRDKVKFFPEEKMIEEIKKEP